LCTKNVELYLAASTLDFIHMDRARSHGPSTIHRAAGYITSDRPTSIDCLPSDAPPSDARNI
jgi:hypothetical protein